MRCAVFLILDLHHLKNNIKFSKEQKTSMILSTAQMKKTETQVCLTELMQGHTYGSQNWPYWLLLWVPTLWLLLRSADLVHGYIEKNYFDNKPTPVLSAFSHSPGETLFPSISLALSYKDKNILSLSLTSYLLHWTSRVIFSPVILSVTCLLLSASQRPAQRIQGDLSSVSLWASIKLPGLLWFQNLYCR